MDIAIEEGLRFKQFGGSSVIDVTNVGIGRDPVATARIARSTGLKIILGSGYYVEETCPELKRLSEEQITEEIMRDITVGIDNTSAQNYNYPTNEETEYIRHIGNFVHGAGLNYSVGCLNCGLHSAS